MGELWNRVDTDMPVVGGGVAGSMAAIPALESGLKVVICEKGKVLDRCGSIVCGVDHYLTPTTSISTAPTSRSTSASGCARARPRC